MNISGTVNRGNLGRIWNVGIFFGSTDEFFDLGFWCEKHLTKGFVCPSVCVCVCVGVSVCHTFLQIGKVYVCDVIMYLFSHQLALQVFYTIYNMLNLNEGCPYLYSMWAFLLIYLWVNFLRVKTKATKNKLQANLFFIFIFFSNLLVIVAVLHILLMRWSLSKNFKCRQVLS